jgi:uncharacterized protein (DUF427 family)
VYSSVAYRLGKGLDQSLDQDSGKGVPKMGANPAPGFRRDPSYRIAVEPFDGIVTVRLGDAVLASSAEALTLREADRAPVFYIPFGDIYFEFLKRSATATHCPFKGEASYWSAALADGVTQDVMWAYEQPYDEMLEIGDHGAFYPGKVRIETTPPAA